METNSIASRSSGRRFSVRKLAGVLFLLITLLAVFLENITPLFIVLLYLAVFILFIVGEFVANEPEHSLIIDSQGLTFIHRRGRYFIPWNNVQRIDIPTTFQFPNTKKLNYIGIKLKRPREHYESVPLKLASRILIEQRELQGLVAKQACSGGSCDLGDVADQIYWTSDDGHNLDGLIAMYASRSDNLAKYLGFQVFISSEAFLEDIDIVLKKVSMAKNESNMYLNTRQP
ncbi:DUF2982 domain-containing protein [Psychrosphaera sp.]|nr:DUF2982 domain-containing protein [Psychrosphaera sp.]